MTAQPMFVCESCREPVDPDDPDVIRAVEQVDVSGFGQPRELADGLDVLFHADCFPRGSARYRLTT